MSDHSRSGDRAPGDVGRHSGELQGRFSTAELPGAVIHGRGALASLPAELDRLGVRRALILTTRSLVGSGVIEQATDSIADRVVEVFEGCRQHTPRAAVEAVVTIARATDVDAVVTVGGGSVVDTGKQVVLTLAEEGLRRHVALPTTLSGSEYTSAAAVTDGHGNKEVTRHPVMAPQCVVLDPALTVATPQRLWAASGVKIISDAVEQLCSVRASPIVDVLASRSIAVLADHLPVDDPTAEDSRLRCQIASWMCLFGMFGAGTLGGLAAGLRHQLAARHDLPHGVMSAALLPSVLRALLPHEEGVRSLLAAAFGVASEETGPVVAAVEAFLERLDLPTELTALGLGPSDVASVADGVFDDLITAGSPLPVDTPRGLVALFTG